MPKCRCPKRLGDHDRCTEPQLVVTFGGTRHSKSAAGFAAIINQFRRLAGPEGIVCQSTGVSIRSNYPQIDGRHNQSTVHVPLQVAAGI